MSVHALYTRTLLGTVVLTAFGLSNGAFAAPANDSQMKATSTTKKVVAPLNEDQKIVHVLNRLGFGPRPNDVADAKKIGISRWIEMQLDPLKINDSAVERKLGGFKTLSFTLPQLMLAYEGDQLMTKQLQNARKANRAAKIGETFTPKRDELKPRQIRVLEQARAAGFESGVSMQVVGEMQSAKLLRALESKRQLQEVLTDFWSNHFNIDVKKRAVRTLRLADERDAIRPNVLGSFRALLGASAHSPAMLIYLDNASSSVETTIRNPQRFENLKKRFKKNQVAPNANATQTSSDSNPPTSSDANPYSSPDMMTPNATQAAQTSTQNATPTRAQQLAFQRQQRQFQAAQNRQFQLQAQQQNQLAAQQRRAVAQANARARRARVYGGNVYFTPYGTSVPGVIFRSYPQIHPQIKPTSSTEIDETMMQMLDADDVSMTTTPKNAAPKNVVSTAITSNATTSNTIAPKASATPILPDAPKKTRGGVNENYARELMELHTLGVGGGYTQQDVQEVARCFTGWSVDRETGQFRFYAQRHDDGEKTVLGQKIAAGGGEKDGERVLDILASHPSTARFISNKMCKRLVSDTPPAALVERVSQVFLKTNGDLKAVTRAIVTSPEFMSPQSFRSKIKSPFEYSISAARALDATYIVPDTSDADERRALVMAGGVNASAKNRYEKMASNKALGRQIGLMGEPLYAFQAPTGYSEDSQSWVSSGALIARLNFALDLTNGRVSDLKISRASLFQGVSTTDKTAWLQRLETLTLQGDVSPATKKTLQAQIAPDAPFDAAKIGALLLGSPEFQRR